MTKTFLSPPLTLHRSGAQTATVRSGPTGFGGEDDSGQVTPTPCHGLVTTTCYMWTHDCASYH